MMLSQEIEETYNNVRKANKNYSLGNMIKNIAKGTVTFGSAALILLSPGTADAQTRQKITKRQLTARTAGHYPGRKAIRTAGNPVTARSHGIAVPRTARFPFYYSRGYYGYAFGGRFFPFGIGPYSRIGIMNFNAWRAGGMFCRFPVYHGPWGVPIREAEQSREIQEYQARIRELEQENERLRERKPQVIERTWEVAKEAPVTKEVKEHPEYTFGYEHGGMYPSQWVSETASYFNWHFNNEGNMLHAYSNAAVYVDGKKYYFDIVVRDGNKNLYVFEFRGNGDQQEKEKIRLIETGKVGNAYIITPTSDSGQDLERQLRPYRKMMLHTNS